ncbi:MAG: hypothetical protein A2102_03100 [Tenericutes bacterium GWF2_38_8]|nr:MAG: hypothetical protein A2Y43_03450 [Tenericutes bacterium GWA2_38_26]OHE42328.1 MAG: hypothetical protein A2102_03100 [Tenericutes bacterium GWF2_38_8]HBG32295.1 hypothetical protein [Acholeplasmataceae bacterium]HCB67610.1 hypothetical protein [Acholeplasmataceae bacterium]
MFTNENIKSCRIAIYAFAIIQMMLLISFLVVLFLFNHLVETGAYILLYATALSIISLLLYLERSKNKVYHPEYRIKSIDHSINLPDEFKKIFKVFLPDGQKAFYSSNGIIPVSFVASVEGRKAKLVEKLTEIDKFNHYKLLYLFKKQYALIEDIWCNKHLVHAEDLEIATLS